MSILQTIDPVSYTHLDVYKRQVTAHGVEVSGGDNPYDTQSYVKAQRMADVLASMLRNAGGTMTTVAPVSYTHLDVYKRKVIQ